MTTNLVGEVIVISDDSDTSAQDQSHARAIDQGNDAKLELGERRVKADEIEDVEDEEREDDHDNKDEEGEDGDGEEDLRRYPPTAPGRR